MSCCWCHYPNPKVPFSTHFFWLAQCSGPLYVQPLKMHTHILLAFFSQRITRSCLPGKIYTHNIPIAIIEVYYLEAISHHSAPNWTVCLLHFHFPLSPLLASLWDRPEKWHSTSHWASLSSNKAHRATHRSHAWLPLLIASTLCTCEGRQQTKRGTGRSRVKLRFSLRSFHTSC